jgi:hypothetical protein
VADTGLAGVIAPSTSGNSSITATVAGMVTAPDGSQRLAIDLYGDKLVSFAIDPSTSDKIGGTNGTTLGLGESVTMLASVAQQVVHSAINLTGIRQANGFLMRDGRLVLVFVEKDRR